MHNKATHHYTLSSTWIVAGGIAHDSTLMLMPTLSCSEWKRPNVEDEKRVSDLASFARFSAAESQSRPLPSQLQPPPSQSRMATPNCSSVLK